MLAFSQFFYVVLGASIPSFNDGPTSILTLIRALFGDFEMSQIMESGGWNAALFLVYLFVAVFILLSMFLAILGEAQAAVREDEAAEAEAVAKAHGSKAALRELAASSFMPAPRGLQFRAGADGRGADGGGGTCLEDSATQRHAVLEPDGAQSGSTSTKAAASSRGAQLWWRATE